MIFWQGLIISLLSGAVGGIIVLIIDKILQFRYEKLQKQKQLYGKLIGLKDLVCDYLVYNIISRINFDYYRFWLRLSTGDASELSQNEIKIHQQNIKETEFARSERFSELFETLGLIWATFPKNQKLDNLIKECFNIKSIPINYPKENMDKDDIQKWREEEIRIRESIQEEVNKPLDSLIIYLHKKVIDC